MNWLSNYYFYPFILHHPVTVLPLADSGQWAYKNCLYCLSLSSEGFVMATGPLSFGREQNFFNLKTSPGWMRQDIFTDMFKPVFSCEQDIFLYSLVRLYPELGKDESSIKLYRRFIWGGQSKHSGVGRVRWPLETKDQVVPTSNKSLLELEDINKKKQGIKGRREEKLVGKELDI